MPKYEIFAGLGGGFGGAVSHGFEKHDNEESANQSAYEAACEDYDNMAGLHGLMSYQECLDQAEQELSSEIGEFEDPEDYQNELEVYANDIYQEEQERWIDYWVKEVKE